jgi:hypothetical protein
LAARGVGEQFVCGNAGRIERHEHGCPLYVFREIANALAIHHLDDFVDPVA